MHSMPSQDSSPSRRHGLIMQCQINKSPPSVETTSIARISQYDTVGNGSMPTGEGLKWSEVTHIHRLLIITPMTTMPILAHSLTGIAGAPLTPAADPDNFELRECLSVIIVILLFQTIMFVDSFTESGSLLY